MARRALGRGLEALLPRAGGAVAPPPADSPGDDREVPLTAISLNPAQPRQVFDPDALAGLAESIRQFGILQPLLVRNTSAGYELIAGERRLRAAAMAGLTSVPVVVRESDELERMELALVENLQREDLGPLEEAAAYRRLMDEFGLTQETVAQRVGKSRPAVANALRLLGLPESVKAMVDRGQLSAGHARAVLAVEGADAQLRFARDLVERQISKAEAEKLVQARRPVSGGSKRGRPARVREDPNVRSVADRLTRSLGTRVRIVPRRKGGAIEIEYYSNEELDRLISRLTRGDEAF